MTLVERISLRLRRIIQPGSLLQKAMLAGLLLIAMFAVRGNAQPGEILDNRLQLRSNNGLLEATLTVAPATFEVNGQPVTSIVYNGVFTPPVLRVHPGDQMLLHVKNQSDQPTNLHYHGLNISPIPPADNIFAQIPPGSSYDYQLAIPPEHRSGLYWYHSHQHGLAEAQLLGGLSGAFIVEGLSDHLPESLQNITERIMLLADIPIKNGKVPADFDSADPTNRLLNGQVNPTLQIAPGETQLWRIANIGADIYYKLELAGHKLAIVGTDGNPVNEVKQVRTLLIPPGGRYDLLVQGGKRGSYAFKTLRYNTGPDGDQYPTVTMATLRSEGAKQSPVPLPTQLNNSLPDLRQATITQDRAVVFSETSDGNSFFINDKQFDHNRIDTMIPLGAVERWTIKNNSNEQHVFHIHQTDFQVVKVNGKPQKFYGYQDVVNVDQQGEVEIIIPFTNPVIAGAPFVYHCHILGHEDKGMMAIAQVNAPNASGISSPPPVNQQSHY